MLVRNGGAFIKGLALVVTFGIVFTLMFVPLFNGENALEAADRLFNSISKGSTDFIPGLLKKNQAFKGTNVTVKLSFPKGPMAENAAKILGASGAKAQMEDDKLTVTGDLSQILSAALLDSKTMFANDAEPLKQKYGISGKESLYTWWNALKQIDKDLTRQKRFKEAAFVSNVVKRGVEVAYNFFGIKSREARGAVGKLAFAMVFYVIYTLWWGIAVLLIFQGIGMQLKHAAKKEI